MTDLAKTAKVKGIKYFLISYVDLFGTMRAKLVPAAAIDEMAKNGAGFAGFASWLDMTPADPDVLAIPDPDSLIQLPWRKEVGWLAADPYMNGKLVEQAPRNVLKRVVADAAAQGLHRSRPALNASSSSSALTARPFPTPAIIRRSPATISRR